MLTFPVEHPFYYYAALSAAMAACLYLFISLKQDLKSNERKTGSRIDKTDAKVERLGIQGASLDSRVSAIGHRTTDVEERIELLSGARLRQIGSAGIDLNQRTQVLRLARRGDAPERIAEELQVPPSEVNLVVKVHRAIAGGF